MTSKEYLQQATLLDSRINASLEEIRGLREMALQLSCVSTGERVIGSKNSDAPFARPIERVIDMERMVDDEIDRLITLKQQIREAINTVPNPNERMVLEYRYVHCYSWNRMSSALHASARTVFRWHDNALEHIILPDDPIEI